MTVADKVNLAATLETKEHIDGFWILEANLERGGL